MRFHDIIFLLMIQSEYIALTSPKNVDDLDFFGVEMVISDGVILLNQNGQKLFS